MFMSLSLKHVPESFSFGTRKEEILVHHVNGWHQALDSVEFEHEPVLWTRGHPSAPIPEAWQHSSVFLSLLMITKAKGSEQ